MKTKILFAMLMLINHLSIAAEIPRDLSLSCWDGTFAYNHLEVQAKEDQLHFTSSSETSTIYRNLPQLDSTFITSVSFSVPLKNCQSDESDSRILRCTLSSLRMKIESRNKPEATKTVDFRESSISLRKVTSMSQFARTTTGFELLVENRNELSGFTQAYNYGLNNDESDNCQQLKSGSITLP